MKVYNNVFFFFSGIRVGKTVQWSFMFDIIFRVVSNSLCNLQ